MVRYSKQSSAKRRTEAGTSSSTSYFLQFIADYCRKAYYRKIWTLSSPFPGNIQYLVSMEEILRSLPE
ncbi:hypothetical protein DPMN_153384 [Dreissena polymorpha]|uniref:Uncharacterized protein n=1 Tax=Dreissena polymorpha TaxID=45954 RepID=A0A9D4FLG6_DREPO|nr:hypothetical protein DPMN_153384 [Dreissena polymorpha]